MNHRRLSVSVCQILNDILLLVEMHWDCFEETVTVSTNLQKKHENTSQNIHFIEI